MRPRSVVVYGDFNCPWSYLASRRVERLAADGLQVDWRAVEHHSACASRNRLTTGFEALRDERDRVVDLLLPGETFPHTLAGFVPCTKAAVAGYAEAYGSGVGPRVRQLLFEAFWLHGIDLGDARLVRTLLVDAIRSGGSKHEAVREWGYAVDVTGAPITTDAHALMLEWRAKWSGTGREVVPALMVDGVDPLFGEAAVRWLGGELAGRGLDPSPDPPRTGRTVPSDLPGLSWTTQQGGAWNRAFQDIHRGDALRVG
jgi:hypothetical protein